MIREVRRVGGSKKLWKSGEWRQAAGGITLTDGGEKGSVKMAASD